MNKNIVSDESGLVGHGVVRYSGKGFVRPVFDKVSLKQKIAYGACLALVFAFLYIIGLNIQNVSGGWFLWGAIPLLVFLDSNFISIVWFRRPAWLPIVFSAVSAFVWVGIILFLVEFLGGLVLLIPVLLFLLDLVGQFRWPFRAFIVLVSCFMVPVVHYWAVVVGVLLLLVWGIAYYHFNDVRTKFRQELERTQNTLQMRIRQLQVSEKGLYIDALTQVLNRKGFTKIASEVFAESSEKGLPVGFIFFDIDHFKKINDTYGHDKGDVALKVIASVVNKEIRPHSDYLARVGGEEFVIMTTGVDTPEKLGLFAERVRKVVESTFWDKDKRLTISVGYSLYPHNGKKTIEECIKCADVALYMAKNTGRNKSMLFVD